MKNSFLYKIANCYAKQDEGNLRNLCFVFPSRRSGLFFTKYLGQCSGKPIFAPRIATIGDLFDELSFYTRTDRIELISILYDNYLKIVSSESFNIDSFDEFVYKAETLLSDFGDIDKYLVDADDLFANITDLESISDSYDYLSLEQRQAIVDFWKITLEGAQSKEGPLKFIQLWKILSPLYHSFKADLDSRGLAYEGMIYRSVAQQIDEQDPHIEEILGQYDRIVFVGHNALCNCEKKLFNYIRNNDMGDFYWDFYGDLLQDNNNKASKFLSSYISDYPSRYAINVINPSYPEIDIVNVPSGIGQAKKVSEYLKLMNSNETAVILPDSTMLMPLLNSIPENVQNINVTMGYGLSNSSFASFMAAANAMQLGKKKRKEAFYHQDVMALLSHTITVTICPTEAKELATTIVNNNLISVPQSILSESESDFLKLLFTPESSVNDLMDWQLNLIDAIAP
ncbi:MAG: hypothetical protein GX664_07605, partial [Bacteroidales bacterium]|nr:hypothetical protein [Bacteroidales bacterium]